jgi:hypothetical protein
MYIPGCTDFKSRLTFVHFFGPLNPETSNDIIAGKGRWQGLSMKEYLSKWKGFSFLLTRFQISLFI